MDPLATYYSVSFAFAGPDQLMMSPEFNRTWQLTVTASLVAFPEGKALSKLKLPPGPLFQATDPGFVLVRPFGQKLRADGKPRAAAVEFRTGKMIISEAPALDVLGSQYVTEQTNGDVGLYERGQMAPKATVKRGDLRRGDPR